MGACYRSRTMNDPRTHRERMIAGDIYDPEAAELVGRRLQATQLTEQYNRTSIANAAVRKSILDDLFGHAGEAIEIRTGLQVDYGSNISIGARTFANFGFTALDVSPITIGEDVQIGPNVQLLTPTHPIDPAQRRAKIEASKPITIGDNVWLGGGVIVCPGVTIGENTVVGAGSVVVKSLPANVVAVGNPARIVKRI